MSDRASKKIRRAFLDYFAKQAATRWSPSSSLVPHNDPTLLFTNAGHEPVQGRLHRQDQADLHARDQLAEVRARRRQAQRPRERRPHRAPPHVLRDAGQLLVRRLLQGRRDRLRLGAADQELRHRSRAASSTPSTSPTTRRARSGRRSPASATTASSRLGDKDNFWAMGETGPCGPCSEIHYLPGRRHPLRRRGGRRPAARARPATAIAGSRSGTWSSCSSSRSRPATRRPLPKPSVDTGMGLERLCAVLQGVRSNYETDLLRPLIDRVAEAVGQDVRPRRLRGARASRCASSPTTRARRRS